MATRKNLSEKMKASLNGLINNFYFEPPSNHKINYPCVIYNRQHGIRFSADDGLYLHPQNYMIMVVSDDPDFNRKCSDKLLNDIPNSSLINCYSKNNLHYDILTIYY